MDYELEKEANEIYTRNIFNDVQEEIHCAINKCMSLSTTQADDFMKFKIQELDYVGLCPFEVCFLWIFILICLLLHVLINIYVLLILCGYVLIYIRLVLVIIPSFKYFYCVLIARYF